MSNFSFTKLFSSITESTIWAEPDHIRIVWITMLAMADMRGRVFATVPGLAGRARVTTEQCKEALDRFKSPDEYSRSQEFEGRRIEDIPGGWGLLNYDKYRAMRDHEKDKERKRNWIAKKRAADRSRQGLSTVDHGGPGVALGRPKTEDRRQKEEIPAPAVAGGPTHTRIYGEEAAKAGVVVVFQTADVVALAKVLKEVGDEAKYREVCSLYFTSKDKFVIENGFSGRHLPGKLQAILNFAQKARPAIDEAENARRARAAKEMR